MNTTPAAEIGALSRDPHQLADVELADRLVALERLSAQVMAAQLATLAVFDARGAFAGEGAVSSAAWLRGTLHVGAGDAAARVRAARRLRDEQPRTAAALAAGDISWPHARVISETLGRTGERLRARQPVLADIAAADAVVTEAEHILVDAAKQLDPRETGVVARRWQALVDPAGFEGDQDAQVDARSLHISPTYEGMVRIDGQLDAESGHVVMSAIEGLSGRDGLEDMRIPAQRRADALVEVCRQALDNGTAPIVGGEKPHVQVEITLDTLERRSGHAPGELTRTGPITAETARRLACDAQITRIITGADGQPLDIGRATRTIPPAIRRALVKRDRGCSWPGCDMRPEWTDAHHIQHWADGGPTTLNNLRLLCRRHHKAAHQHDQQATGPP